MFQKEEFSLSFLEINIISSFSSCLSATESTTLFKFILNYFQMLFSLIGHCDVSVFNIICIFYTVVSATENDHKQQRAKCKP